MITVVPRPEPNDFNKKVRVSGQNFLAIFPNPTKDDWKKRGKKIWQRASKQLRDEYDKICAYSAIWVPSGEKSIDHFIPRSADKTLAFEWSNFRFCLDIINQYKSSEIILDPFKIGMNWFVIDFDLNLVRPNKENEELDSDLLAEIDDTITKLQLNEYILQQRRLHWIHAYYKGMPATIEGLRRKAPFIAYELERQGLVEEIKVKHENFLRDTGKT